MAHQNKFVSVNLNRSYGRPSSSSPSSAFGHGRSRFGSVGGMVVLSRPRSSSASMSKSATRLAVPPPLNLPSLRKEHERFDPASSGASAGHGTSGLGSIAGSTAMGWNKPVIHLPSAEDAATATPAPSQLARSTGSSNRLSGSAYVPPGSHPGTHLLPASFSEVFAEKAVILRGEDFPSLRATALALKQKENLGQKQKQKQIGEDRQEGRAELPDSRPPIEMRPQTRSSQFIMGNAGDDDGGSNIRRNTPGLSQKNNGYLPSPLPLVRLQHTSDWADDERDTELSLPERARDRGFSRFQSFESHEVYERGRDGNPPLGEFFKGDSFRRDVKPAVNGSHDFGSWRSLPKRDRLSTHDFGVDKDSHNVRPSSANRVVQTPFGGKGQDGFSHGNQDSWYPRRDMVSHVNTQNIKAPAETLSGRSVEQNARGRYADPSNNWYKGGSFQNDSIAKNHSSSVNKGSSLIDPVTSFSKEKRSVPSAGKPYTVETGFDSKDPFTRDVGDVKLKVFKKKKDDFNHTYFHDPIRESFEAELDRILMMQEQERKRIMEERARMLVQARKQEEEPERLAREEDERRRLLEEETREAAWRAEQDNLEASKRIEEQRIAREEENKIYQIEEERRKEAARRKLLELEARMARRRAEEKPEVDGLPSADDERISSSAKKRDISQLGDMEDGERMMESIPTFVLSDNLGTNRNLDAGSRSQSSSSGNLPFMDLGKHSLYSSSPPVQDQVQHSPRLDAFGSRRGTFKKEIHGGCNTINARASSRGGSGETSEAFEDYRQPRQHRWNNDTDGDHFRKNFDLDNGRLDDEKFVEVGWAHGNSHGRPQASYGERSLQSFEDDELPSFTRYRQFLRQPRVPPPPSVTSSMQRSSFGSPVDRDNSSFVGDKTYHLPDRNELQNSQAGCDGSYDTLPPISVTPSLEENALHSEQMQEKINSGYDSLSTLSISSAPNSPTLLLHDEMDVAGDSPALPTSADGERTMVSDNEHVKSTMESSTLNRLTTSSSVSLGEDDDWGTGNHDNIHEQEYHDDEDDYQEITEVHECSNDSIDMEQKIDDSHSDGQTANEEMEQVILGFDEGVEVKIPVNNDFEMTRNENKDMENVLSYGNKSIPEVTVNDSLSVIRDTEKAMQGLVLDPVATSYATNTLEVSLSSVMSPQHIPSPSPSLTQMPTSTLSNVSCSATVSQGEEAPVKLQFGLFSGPSLIPSPVSAIQIGSIQMPIHVHTQITPSLHHVHPSQPPLFQFGLLRYPPPISQNVLPLAPQNMPFIPSRVPDLFSFNQKPAGCLSNQASQDSCHSKSGEGNHSCSSNKQSGFPSDFSYEHVNASPDPVKSGTMASQNQTERCPIAEKKNNIGFVSHQHDDMPVKQSRQPYQKEQLVEMLNSHSSVWNAPAKVRGVFSASRGKRYANSARNYGSRLSFPGVENISNGFQRRARRSTCRTEFRVRENVEKKQISGSGSLDYIKQDEKSNANGRTSGITARSVGKKDVSLSRSFRISETNDLNLGSSSRVASSDVKTLRATRKDSASKIVTPYGKSNALKSKLNSDENIDAPLQSGVVCVFKQPGIETPSDEDDFIKVRSKRQMLNDRREQREKENKSKSKVLKMPRKQHIALQSNASISNSKKAAISLLSDTSNNVHSSSLVTARKNSSKHGHSLAFASNTSQTLSPIDTTLVNVDSEARSNDLKPSQEISYPAESTDMMKLAPTILFETKVATVENHTSPINTWDCENVNQQVMALTQTQLDEAMKPAKFDSPLAPNISLKSKTISCIMTQEKSFPSCSSTISSLLGGEKIQFGVVTSPTILPPVNRAISNGLGPPGSNRSEVKANPTLVATNDDCVMFFGKEKHHGKSFTNLEDHEAVAAASAFAVAAISNDEVVASGIGGSSASATSDSKSFNNSDVTGLTSGGGTVSQVANGEESLTIALPADLSVDTPSLSLWPPLPSPQASGPMLSHYPGAQSSLFPFFDMNSVLDGRIFAYGPNDESSGSQVQSQRSGNLGSGPLGALPQCHSGVDSFYGPPTFAGPFISHGGIPGVQGPPHMVVYNHFAPVGRFGQLGLSFMGTPYLTASNPSGQKQNQVCSTTDEGKDCNSGNVSIQQTSPGTSAPIQHLGPGSSLMPVFGQGPMPNMPGTIQHLGPGSPLLPMASPLTMFDITPFQSATGIPMQGHWPHVPAPPLHSVPVAIPSQQHRECGMSTQFDQSLPINTSLVSNRLQDSLSSLPAGLSTNFPAPSTREPCFPHELGLLEQPISTTGSTQSVGSSHTAGSGNITKVTRTATRTMVTSLSDNGSIGANSSTSNTGAASKSKQSSSSGPQYLNPVGHLDKQGGAAQKNASGGEWHRRAGFHRRKQGSGSDKNFGFSKMKQIYVPKPSSNTASNQS